ncbi:MAG: hypothetical protein HZA53_13970 [Planctomycetes bacterium]|nr:hypothetical protein [Planctomycetota bacterium]
MRDEFLSEEDLDLKNLSWEELLAYWDLWLLQAQSSNELDAHLYSHGVFRDEPRRAKAIPDVGGMRVHDSGSGDPASR